MNSSIHLLLPLALTLALALAAVVRAAETKTDRPNLLIIHTDEHNFRTLGCYRALMSDDQAFAWGAGVKEVPYNPKDTIVPPFLPDTNECREELAQYYQSTSRIDQGFGRHMGMV